MGAASSRIALGLLEILVAGGWFVSHRAAWMSRSYSGLAKPVWLFSPPVRKFSRKKLGSSEPIQPARVIV